MIDITRKVPTVRVISMSIEANVLMIRFDAPGEVVIVENINRGEPKNGK